MGQFYSREFDGDPYIDLMRALPERELIWWAQKVIWLAEGFTFVDHFCRTYPRLFQHKCLRCNGTGVLTCPACAGTKVPLTHPAKDLPDQHLLPRQPPLVGPAPAMAGMRAQIRPTAAGSDLLSSPFGDRSAEGTGPAPKGPDGVVGGGAEECRVCGEACAWDAESDWMERWNEWEARLAYYDKATGPLMDEWYEDILNAGNLEEDTQPAEDEPPGPEVKGRWADDARLLSKDKKRLAALMKRFGHPYDGDATLGYQIVDPTASMGENIWNMAQVYNSLPPELNPMRLEGLDRLRPDGNDPAARNQAAMDALDEEVFMEAAIMQNLDAAVRDLPKPYRFIPTAGTIPCSECAGAAWGYSVFPNTERLFGIERPLWTDTLARLSKYWNPTSLSDPSRTGQALPYGEHGLRSLLRAAEGEDPLEELRGRVPESTGRYRRELELLVANPELRDGRLRLPEGRAALEEFLQNAEGIEQEDRDLAALAVPLELSAAPNGGRKGRQQQQEQQQLALSRA